MAAQEPKLPPLQGRVGVGHVHASVLSVAKPLTPQTSSHPNPPARRVSPRRRGPRLGSRLRGRTRKRKSACEAPRVPVRPDNCLPPPDGQTKRAGTTTTASRRLIACPTRPEKRTVTRCPRPPSSPRHRPHTSTPPPHRKCFPASTLPILPCCSINARHQQTAALPTPYRANQSLPRAQRKRTRGPSPPRPSSTRTVPDYSAAAVPLAGRMSRRSAIRAALPVRPRR